LHKTILEAQIILTIILQILTTKQTTRVKQLISLVRPVTAPLGSCAHAFFLSDTIYYSRIMHITLLQTNYYPGIPDLIQTQLDHTQDMSSVGINPSNR